MTKHIKVLLITSFRSSLWVVEPKHVESFTFCVVDGDFSSAALLIAQLRIIFVLKVALHAGPGVKTHNQQVRASEIL